MLNPAEVSGGEETLLFPPLSFVLALAVAQAAPRGAACVIPNGGAPRIEVVRFGLDERSREHLQSLATMDPVNLCIDALGRRVAVTQRDELYLFGDGPSARFRFDEPVEQFGFVGEDRLVLRTGTQLFFVEAGSVEAKLIRSDLRQLIVGDPIVGVCVSGRVELLRGNPSTTAWEALPNLAIPGGARAYVQTCPDGFLVLAEGSHHGGSRRCSLYRVEFASPKPALLFDEPIADTIGRDPARQFFAWRGGRVLLLAERGHYRRLWLVDRVGAPRPVSPENVEVFSVSPNAGQGTIALIGSDISKPETSPTRSLHLLEERANVWTSRAIAAGSFLLPKWCDGSRLVYARDWVGQHRWTIAERATAGLLSAAPPPQTFRAALRRDAHGTPYTVVRSVSAGQIRAAILYIQGPHRQVTSGAQDTFFHHWLLSCALRAASPDATVLGLNPPGSLGLGALTRQPTNSLTPLIARTAEVLSTCIEEMAGEGVERFGILSGSLGALPVLRSLERLSVKTACCFVSPVLDPAGALDPAWLNLFGGREPCLDQMAKGTKLMVIHGERDEFTPAADCVRFVRSLRSDVDAKLVVLSNEGHIFRNRKSWEEIEGHVFSFFRAAL